MRRRVGFVLGLAAVLATPWKLHAAAKYIGMLPQGDAVFAKSTVHQVCASCHGTHGIGTMPQFPNLAGQSYSYLLEQLENFRSGSRKNQTMSMIIKTVPAVKNDKNIKDLATYYSQQKPQYKPPAKPLAGTKVLQSGANIYQGGLQGKKVPSCSSCHGASALGNAPMAVPALAGQHAPYVLAQLQAFGNGKRDNSPKHVMANIAGRLSQSQMKAVADYVASINPSLMLGTGPKTYSAYTQTLSKLAVPGVPAAASGSAEKSAQ